jgi:hypothetical protein
MGTSLPTAARLADFRALSAGNGAQLAWGALVENSVLGFRVDRSVADGGWTRLTAQMIPATGWNGRPQTYELVDAQATAGVETTYRLVETDLSGREHVLAVAFLQAGMTTGIARSEAGLSLNLSGASASLVNIADGGRGGA